MTVILHPLHDSPHDRNILHTLCLNTFLQGECYAFALALHEGLCWPLVGLMHEGLIWHAGVRSPDGMIHDVRGPLTDAEFGSVFLNPPFDIRDIEKSQLFTTRPIAPHVIQLARKFAEAIWPELPWKGSFHERADAFARDLEELSRRHGLWIFGATPGSLPLLSEGDGGEGGYTLTTTPSLSTLTITRHFDKTNVEE